MNLQGIKKRIVKILVYSITSIIFLLIYTFLVLQIPAVQNVVAKQFLTSFSGGVGFNSTIENVRFSWFDRLVLEGVRIEDREHNEMIFVKRLTINYKISELFNKQNINLDAVGIDSARVFFTRIQESDSTKNLNFNVFIKNINQYYGASGGGGKPPKVNIGEALINDTRFAYDNTGKDSLSGFDYNHFSVMINEGELQNFVVLGDTIEFNVSTLAFKDAKTNFEVSQLSTFFRISQKSLEFQGIDLRAGRSHITDTIIFKYDSQNDLNDFVNKVKVDAHLTNTIINPADLVLFAPAAKKLSMPVKISGDMLGTINNFRLNNMNLETGSSSFLGSLSMDGLPDINETFIVLNLKRSKLYFHDLSFLFNEITSKRLTQLGTLSFNAEFLGYPTDFVANGDFTNHLGRIKSDINLKIDEKVIERSTYRGDISMINFNLGKYLNDTLTYQKIDMTGRIAGSGFTTNTANFKLVSAIRSLGIKGYNYKNIQTNASFASEFFSGEVTIDDKNIQIKTKGSIDLRNNRNIVNLQAAIDTLRLDKIHLSKDKLFLQAKVDINTSGFVLDSLMGDAHIQNLKLNYNDKWLFLNNITLDATRDKELRTLNLKSDIVDVQTKGNFLFSTVFTDIRVLYRELELNIKNDKDEISKYYSEKVKLPDNYEFDFNIHLKNIESIADLLNLDLAVGRNISIDGEFINGNTTVIHAFTRIDSLQYQNIFMENTEVELNASKLSSNPEALVMAFASSTAQSIGNLKTKNFSTEAIWNKNSIDFKIALDQQSKSNYARLNGSINLNDSTEIKLLKTSKIQLLEKVWAMDTANRITIKNKEISIHHFNWMNEQQSISLSGDVSEDANKKVSLLINNFNLSTINSLSQRALSGTVNAEIIATNIYKRPTIQNEIDIKDLKVDDFLVGNITGINAWDTKERKFNIEFLIDRLGNRIVNCTGYYNPSDKTSPLLVTAKLEKTNLKILEPFIDDILSNFEGTISGLFYLTGTLNAPVIKGSGDIEDGQLMVNYLKTTYQIRGTVGLKPNAIYFEKIELTDAFNNKGKVNGEITHQNFKKMRINLVGSFDRLQLLNTSAHDNSLFYGQGYATGDVRFDGPINNLRITANARTNKNTKIYIPIAGTTSSEKKDFITFTNFTDTSYQKVIKTEVAKKVNLTGVTFDLNLDVTSDAYCEIIFDLKAGDIIRGRGNGRIKLQLDTKGEFNMFGPVVFTEGWYNFTLYDIINKEFKIEPGSSITWFGDPYQGNMQITATYNQLASFLPILSDQTLSNVTQLKRKYPAQVVLKLDGLMLSPQINFDIVARDLPKSITVEGKPPVLLNDEWIAFKNRMDEQEMKRQVFSLIVLRRLSPLESFNTSGTLASSVSEIFSNQLSNWMSQVDENFQIDVDLGSMDKEAFNAFQLRLSYTFLNGRLRVTRDGVFGNQGTSNTTGGSTSGNTGSNYSSIGDWTVDYLLTADGKFKVKMYSRTNVNPVNTLNSQNAITTGVSLLHTQSFNEIKDLLKSSRDKNRRKPEDEDEVKKKRDKEDEGEN